MLQRRLWQQHHGGVMRGGVTSGRSPPTLTTTHAGLGDQSQCALVTGAGLLKRNMWEGVPNEKNARYIPRAYSVWPHCLPHRMVRCNKKKEHAYPSQFTEEKPLMKLVVPEVIYTKLYCKWCYMCVYVICSWTIINAILNIWMSEKDMIRKRIYDETWIDADTRGKHWYRAHGVISWTGQPKKEKNTNLTYITAHGANVSPWSNNLYQPTLFSQMTSGSLSE